MTVFLRRIAALVLLAFAVTSGVPAGAGPAGGVLRIGIDVDAGTLDPRLANDTTARRVIEQVYDGLIELDAQLQPRPALAESWTQVSPTVWVFRLRRGVRFHDGTPFTAEDVVFTFQTILDPALRAPLRGLVTPISKVEAVDEATVRFTLSAPYAPLLRYLDGSQAGGIVSKRAVERLGAQFASNPVGTGAFKFVSWQRNSRITLEANTSGWRRPSLTQIIFNIIPDNSTRAAAVESGDVDLIHSPLSPQDVRRLRTVSRVSVTQMTGLGHTYLNINMSDPILRDVRVRRAIAHLIPQTTIVRQIYQEMDRPANSILLPAWTGIYTDDITQPGHDIARAKALLAEAGWTDSNRDGVLDQGGRNFSLVVRTHSEDPNRIQIVELLISILRSSGIEARAEITEFPALVQALIAGTHQIALVGWLGLVDPDRGMYNQFHSKGSQNWERYTNARVDALLDEGRQKADPAERARIYREVARIIAADLPYYILTYQGYIVVVNRRVQGFTPIPSGSFRSLWQTSTP
ncbi:MAG TPA: ABC transporter substrate-binding protein [bacterium]|jgi:peptide/nickel transport system substrate-binding protein|nr:ABC transporter substrate-binding protein [bacterium]